MLRTIFCAIAAVITITGTTSAVFNIRISGEEAIAIAEKEAEKECYDYQGWDSVFKAGSLWLCTTEEEFYQEAGVHYNYLYGNDSSYYIGRPIWVIRLFDDNDALTSLFLFVDADTGEILGYKRLSD